MVHFVVVVVVGWGLFMVDWRGEYSMFVMSVRSFIVNACQLKGLSPCLEPSRNPSGPRSNTRLLLTSTIYGQTREGAYRLKPSLVIKFKFFPCSEE